MRVSQTHMPIRGRLRISRTMFPMYRLAMTVQTKSGFFWKRSGPGCRPYTRSPPRSTASGAEAGMPSARSGMNPAEEVALLADSGEATPSMAPRPKRSGCLAIRRSAS